MSNLIEDFYSGREHSGIKHLFLRKYLELAAYATMGGGFTSFNYVDGFAGPWSVADEDRLSDSSFFQAIETVLAVKKAVEDMGRKRCRVRFCLCEKEPARVERLRRFAAQQDGIEIHVFEGPFETRLNDIAATCATGFTFTFIDPTGFNLGSRQIADFLARKDGDFLLNFISEHINRYPTVDGVRDTFGRLLADTDWPTRFCDLPTDLKNEHRIMIILKEQMKELGAARYMPDFEIMNPRANRLQMRLILGTRHHLGVEVFRDVQAKVDPAQQAMRDQLRNPGQVSLFPFQAIDSVGSAGACEAARQSVLKYVGERGEVDFEDLIGPVLEDAAIRRTHLKNVLNQMRKSGEVEFNLIDRQKKPDKGTTIRLAA